MVVKEDIEGVLETARRKIYLVIYEVPETETEQDSNKLQIS